MKATRFGQLLIVAFACYTTAAAFAQPSTPDSSTPSSAVRPKSNSKAPTAQTISDRELAKRVRKALARSGMVMVDLTVRARSGVITLIGSVPTEAFLEQAKTVSSAVDGVTSVDNRLIVRIDPRLLNGQSAGTGIPGKPITSAGK